MKIRHIFPRLSFLIFLSFVFFSCQNNRSHQIVPYDTDTEEVLKPLTPNDEDMPDALSFGQDSIPGIILDYDMTTENPDIFVYYQNLTLLNINPSIIQDLFEFTQKQLSDYGFVNQSYSLPENEIATLLNQGSTYPEAASKVLDIQKTEFEAQSDTIASFHSPFNIYFQIYPVYLDKNYITYRLYSYSYTGGAHGMPASYLRTYDLNTGEKLTLNTIVKPESIEEVREEVVAHMAYSYPIYDNLKTVEEYIDSLNVFIGDDSGEESASHDNRITLTNFPLTDPALTKEGLAFEYQMYTLAPGSDGCPIVVIPYKDIEGCLIINPGK